MPFVIIIIIYPKVEWLPSGAQVQPPLTFQRCSNIERNAVEAVVYCGFHNGMERDSNNNNQGTELSVFSECIIVPLGAL